MRWFEGAVLGGVAALAGCLAPSTKVCANGVVCPAELACTENLTSQCGQGPDVDACFGAGLQDRDPCSSALTPLGSCSAGQCTPCTPDLFECRFDGWTAMTSGTTAKLQAVSAFSPQEIYVAGFSGSMLRYDGTQWQSFAPPLQNSNIISLAGTGLQGLFALEGSTVFRFDGASWSVSLPTPRALYAIWAGDGVVMAGGRLGDIHRFDGAQWLTEATTSTNTVYGIWGSSVTDVFAAGHQTIAHYDGVGWSQLAPAGHVDGNIRLSSVWGSGPGDVFAVGEGILPVRSGGVILHYDGGAWTEMSIPPESSTSILNGVWGRASDDVYAVGDGGVLLHYDGLTWRTMSAPGGAISNIFAITGIADDAYAVGGDGTIWRNAR